ncbi:hypothetical protein Hsar01_03161 [Haloferula sargassicola]|uniref:Transposase n=1 Tax=Haloferula sargassicola TaxID=490096 RepID=A0ABP9URF4_9BACT
MVVRKKAMKATTTECSQWILQALESEGNPPDSSEDRC